MATAIARRDLSAEQKANAAPWDDGLQSAWRNRYRNEAAMARRQENERWFAEYDEYLRSAEWRDLRERVITRAAGRCEGCGRRQAQHVHHLTYAHRRHEFMFELVAVCRDCHDRIHGTGRYAPRDDAL